MIGHMQLNIISFDVSRSDIILIKFSGDIVSSPKNRRNFCYFLKHIVRVKMVSHMVNTIIQFIIRLIPIFPFSLSHIIYKVKVLIYANL